MIKTGKRIGFIYLLIFALGFLPNVKAQDISVSAALTETNIFAGESVRLDVTISGQSLNSIDRPNIPNTPGLRWLSGSTSQSTNYSYINGRPSVSYTYGYSFIAQNPGSYTFPPLQIEVNGEQFETKPINFKVLDPETIDQGNAARSPDIYVRLEPSTDNPVVGEQVIANVVLYFKSDVEVSSYQPSPGWKAEGFWKEDLENRQQARTTSTLINGVRYQRAVLLQQAIFPTKSGELTLSPFEVVVQVRKRNRRRDIFSFGLGQERMELNTLPVTVNVRPLPDVDNAVFSGAVGKFEISRTLEPNEAFVGESVEINTSITGQGNIPLIVKPEYEYPEALELYDPQESSSITRNNQQIGGSKTFTDIVIARNEGEYVIPEQRFAYYDPELRRYRNITLPLLTLEVKRDPRLVNSSANEYRFEITPMTGLANWVSSSQNHLHQKTWVWFLLILPIASLAGAFVVRTYTERMNNDSAFARSQKAREKALTTLSEAVKTEDIKSGYHFIEKALIQFVTDKLDLPQAGLSIKELSDAILTKGDAESAQELKRLLDKCETISYAPNTSQEGLNADIQRAKELIKKSGENRMRKVTFVLFVIICGFHFDSVARQNAQIMFDQANTLLEENDFMGALDSYRNIVEIGEVSGPLFLNMGIAAMEIDSMGLAKYYFIKASRFSVTEDKALEALEYVSSQFSRQSAILPKLPWDRAVDRLKVEVGATRIFFLGFLMISISVIVIILSWFKKFEIPKKNTIIGTATTLSVLTVILAFYVDYVDQRYKEGVVIAKEIPVRTNPTENADLVSIAYEGYSITIDAFTSENAEEWYYIRLGNGQFGWIQKPGSKLL